MNLQEQQEQNISKAVIYCRVSSTKQTVRGDGLERFPIILVHILRR